MSVYPNELDDDLSVPPVNDNITEITADTINSLRSAIFTIQSALGTDPQGSATDLKTRLAYFFNDDGTPKQSALVAAGLVALPIDNTQIAANAAIEESKLDLDHNTQDLKDSIDSNDIDIQQLQQLYNQLLFDINQHFLGNSNKHDGYDVTLSGLVGAPAVNSVGLAVNYVWNQFSAHKAALEGSEHNASAIAYTPNPLGPITATNVQDAISEIDTAFYEDRRKHDDSAHSNGISRDGYVAQFGQFAVNDASAAVVRIPTSPNILKVGLINSAVIKSKGFDSNGINVSTNSLKIDVTVGSGLSRSLTVTGLQTAQYPSGYNRRSLKAIVNYLNQQFQQPANHFPVTAFESSDGELVLQHNIANESCTLTVASVSNSAATTLGLGSVINIPSSRIDNYYLSIDGNRYTELDTVSTGSLIHSISSSSVDLGTTTGAGGLGVVDNTFFHVLNHSTTEANGTYRIIGTSLNSVTLNTTLPSGTFDYIIYKDVIDSNFSGNYKTIDLFIDSDRNLVSSVRQETTLVQISGLKIIEISEGFRATPASLTLNFSSPTYSAYLTVGGNNGTTIEFDQGFIGYRKIFAPDNISYITILISDPSPSVGTDQITIYDTELQDDLLLLATTHTDAAAVIEMPLDKRNLGLSGKTAIGTSALDEYVHDNIKNLHSNGIIRGFDILQIDPGNNSVTLNGGIAYVEGKKIIKPRASVNITNTATSNGLWNLVLSENGNLEIYNSTAAGFSFGDILLGVGYLVLAQLTISGGIVFSTKDARFFINDIESKTDLIVDDQDFGGGQFRTIDAAVLNSKFAPNNNKPEIKVISDTTITGDLVIDADTKIVAYRDLTISGDLTISDGATLEVVGDLNVAGTVTVKVNSNLIIGGGSLTEIDIESNTTFIVNGDLSLTDMQIEGNNVLIAGSEDKPTVTFDGSDHGIVMNISCSNVIIKNIDFVMTYAIYSVIALLDASAGDFEDIIIENNTFRQSATFSYPSPTIDRQAIYIETNKNFNNLKITNNYFTNLSHGIEIFTTSNDMVNVDISNNSFYNVNKAIVVSGTTGTITGLTIKNNVFRTVFNEMVTLHSSTLGSVNGVIFSDNFADNAGVIYGTAAMLDASSGCNSIVCSLNTALGLYISVGAISTIVSKNILDGDGCSLVFAPTTAANASISNNVVTNHTSVGLSISGSSATVELIGNIFNTTATGAVHTLAPGIALTCMGNRFVDGGTSASSFVIPNGALFTDNYVESGRIYMSGSADPPGRQSITSNNRFIANGLSATNNFSVLASNGIPEGAIFSNNIITLSGSLNVAAAAIAIRSVANSRITFIGNSIHTSTGGAILEVALDDVSLSAALISDNQFTYTGSAVGIGLNLNHSNIVCTNNVTSGQFNTAEISVQTGHSNIFIYNNTLNGTGSGGKLVSIASGTTSAIARNNKNVIESWTYSALQGTVTGWTTSISLPNTVQVQSSTASGQLIIPLTGLPVGALLETVQVYATTPGGIGTLTLRVFRRPTSSHTLVELGTAVNNVPSIFQIISSSTLSHNIIDDNEYFAILTSSATNNVIGQIVANIRI